MSGRKYKLPASYTTRNMPGCHGQKPSSPASAALFILAVGLAVPIVRAIMVGFSVQAIPLVLVGSLAVAVLLIMSLCLKK